jgi:single-strand DNA-binding protein
MARGLNRIYLVGALTQSPELRYTAGGLGILELTLSGNDVIELGGVKKELPWYHQVKLIGRSADFWADSLKAGALLWVEGHLEYRSWEQEGQKRSSLEIRSDRLEVVLPNPSKGNLVMTDARGQSRLREGLNLALLVGNLTRDAELRYTPQGTPTAHFTLAVNERTRPEEPERAHFIEVQAWRELAEWAAEFHKGEPVFVMGRLVVDSWKTAKGESRRTLRIEASRLERLGRGGGETSSASAIQSGSQATPPDLDEGSELPPEEEDLPF